MKKGPLSKKEKQYIEKNYKSKSIDQMATRMKRSEHMVDKFVKTLDFKVEENDDTKENPAATPPVFKGPVPGDLFARKEDRGVTIMTEAASIASDDSKKNNNSTSTPQRYNKFIHRIKD